jgi:acyl-CoA thioesterase I
MSLRFYSTPVYGFYRPKGENRRMIIRLIVWMTLFTQTSVSAAPIRIACVGDSITAGVGASEGNDYPTELGRMLGQQYSVNNFGVSGSTLLKHGDLPCQNQKAFKNAKAFNPDIVVIKLGTNDTKPYNWRFKDEFVADYKDMINQFRTLPSKPKIFISYPAPVVRQDQSSVNEPVCRIS